MESSLNSRHNAGEPNGSSASFPDKLSAWLYRHRGTTAVPFAILLLLGAHPEPRTFTLGVFISLSGELIRLFAVRAIGPHSRGRSLQSPRLVTEGPYRWTRHPLYLGNALQCAGLLTASRSFLPWFPILFGLVFVIQYGLFVRSEERHLALRWGDDWTRYARDVGALPISGRRGELASDRSFLALTDAFRIEWPTFRTLAGLLLLIALKGILGFR